jgi:hypothetical protein
MTCVVRDIACHRLQLASRLGLRVCTTAAIKGTAHEHVSDHLLTVSHTG